MKSSKNFSTVGQRLRYEREQHNWTQEQLAQELGTTTLSINRWEHDKAFPRPHHRVALCRIFNKSAAVLFDQQQEQGNAEAEHFPIWNVPHLRNLYFTGRDAVLMQLHDTLRARNTVALTQPLAIHGLGGIGKTQVAIEYAYRYRSEYRAVLWARADSEQSLVSDFVALAGLLRLPEREEEDQQRVFSAVKHWLQTHTDWLLILDNADELELIYDFLSPGNGHILVTTRSATTGPYITGIELERMKAEEGTLLLLRRSKRLAEESARESFAAMERSQAEEICALMDGLPLALDQAAAYIEENLCSFEDYLRLYRSHRADLLQQRGIFSIRGYPHSVVTTWSLSFGQLERADATAADLLRLCAFLHPDDIPKEMILAGAAYLGPRLQRIADDPIQLDVAIGVLRRFSLLRHNAEAKTLTIHRLVQMVLRDMMDQETEREWAERTVLAIGNVFPADAFSAWRQRERYLPHALVCTDLIEQWDMRFSEAARLLNHVANQLYEQGKYKEAESVCQHALAIKEQALGAEHPDVAITLNDLAMLYYLQGNYEPIEPLYQRALSIFESRLGPAHPYIAVTLNNLANLYVAQGRYAEAESFYERALDIREQRLGPTNLDLATTLHELAQLLLAQHRYRAAEPYYRRAISIFKQVWGAEHADLASLLEAYTELVSMAEREDEVVPFR